jgi:nucleoside-diphosphate-sugar epimerase
MLIVGCGAVGRKIADSALQRGVSVNCLVRTEESARRLRESGLDARALDLDRKIIAPLDAAGETQVFYLAPPPPEGRQDPRMQRFLAALPEGTQPRIVYISTTGVYGDCKGAWVDERRPANPQVDRARRRRDAELQLLRWRDAVGGEVIILRVAGIYGPGKLPLARLAKQAPMVGESEAPWTNRIHIADLVSVCEAAMKLGRDGECYNVSDGQPGNMRDYFDRVADLFGLPRAPVISLAEGEGQLSAGLLSYLAESRRLDNRKMIEDLGISLRYPDLASGLEACRNQS